MIAPAGRPLSKIGLVLALTYQEYRDYAARGGYGTLGKPFKPSNRLVRTVGETVVVDLAANGDATDLKRDLMALGMLDTAVFGHMVSGRLPVRSSWQSKASRKQLRCRRHRPPKVGTLSDSYDCLGGAAADVASGDLPAGVTVLQEESGCVSGKTKDAP